MVYWDRLLVTFSILICSDANSTKNKTFTLKEEYRQGDGWKNLVQKDRKKPNGNKIESLTNRVVGLEFLIANRDARELLEKETSLREKFEKELTAIYEMLGEMQELLPIIIEFFSKMRGKDAKNIKKLFENFLSNIETFKTNNHRE